MSTDLVLEVPRLDGTAGQAQVVHFAQFNLNHAPLSPTLPLIVSNPSPSTVATTINGLDVDFKAIGSPNNQTAPGFSLVSVSDGRPGVSPVTVKIATVPNTAPDLSSLEVSGTDPARRLP